MDKHKRHHPEGAAAHVDESPGGAPGAKGSGAKDDTAQLKEELQAAQEAKEACLDASEEGKDAISKSEEELLKLKSEMESLKDLMLRRQADFENYKKRQLKMQQEQQKMAVKDLALDIITIHDDLLRAIETASNIRKEPACEETQGSFVQGVDLISKRIVETLKKYGVVEIDSLNQAFDPTYNEAVEIDMSRDVSVDTITKVYLKGFRIDDIVIRSARVRVTRPMREQDGNAGGSGGAEPGDDPGGAMDEGINEKIR